MTITAACLSVETSLTPSTRSDKILFGAFMQPPERRLTPAPIAEKMDNPDASVESVVQHKKIEIAPTPGETDSGSSKPDTTAQRIAELRAKFVDDAKVVDERRRIEADPELYALWNAIIEHGDVSALRAKSQKQLRQLEQRFFGSFSLFKLRERYTKMQKLKQFTNFVEGLRVVRVDDKERDTYLSPERTGGAAHYGDEDVLVRAERYVYASLDQMSHHMARYTPNQRILDAVECAQRAQLAMYDVADTVSRVMWDGPEASYMAIYLKNLFDFETGKKILAVYLASVFDTPDQAMLTFSSTNRHAAQDWDRVPGRLEYSEYADAPDPSLNGAELIRYNRELSATFIERMKLLLAETGILPPLALEVRIADHAQAKKEVR